MRRYTLTLMALLVCLMFVGCLGIASEQKVGNQVTNYLALEVCPGGGSKGRSVLPMEHLWIQWVCMHRTMHWEGWEPG